MAEIVLTGVSKRFPDGTVAVDDVNLKIADGEFVILVGPSGCGKSTTLNMIAGLEDASSGEVIIDGRRMNGRAPRDRDLAMVFQSYALYPHLTVRENIGFPLRLARMNKRKARERIEETAELLDLVPQLDRRPASLSGGQRQRVAMGRAIVRSPKAFLLDEPLSNLDAKLRAQMRTSIARLQRRLGTTTVYVTHDQTEAMTLGDRIVIMRAGVVQQVGSPEELYDHPHNLFVAGFIGSPAMNFLPAEVGSDGLETAIGTIPLGERVRRAMRLHNVPHEVIVGLRPEAFEDAELVRARGGRPHCGYAGVVDVLEAMGSEKIAYVALDTGGVESVYLAEALRETRTGGPEPAERQLVARLDPKTAARRGQRLEVCYDPAAVHLFDPGSGTNLTERI